MIDLIFAAAFVISGGLCCLLIAGVPLGWWDQ